MTDVHAATTLSALEVKGVCLPAASRLYSRCCPVRAELLIPGALSILKGAVPDRTRGFGHTAPTYVSRFPGSNLPRPGRHRISSGDPVADPKIEAEKAALRLKAHA